jgi:hypothetical protein
MNAINRKRHGFDRPLDNLQLISWLYMLFCAVQYYIFIFPVRGGPRYYIFVTFFSLSLISVIVFGFLVTIKDPSDSFSVSSSSEIPINLQISTYRCTICDKSIYRTSKHCSTCNRCTQGFDHHCRWLNNCIGAKNYREFIILIVAFEINQVALIGANFQQIIFAMTTNQLRELISDVFTSSFYYPVLVLYLLVAVSSLVPICVNGYLIGFHILLKTKGLSTYEYIVYKRARKNMGKSNIFPVVDERNEEEKY